MTTRPHRPPRARPPRAIRPRSIRRLLAILAPLALGGCPDVPSDKPGGLVIFDAGPGPAPDGAIRSARPVLRGEIAPVYGFVSPEARVEYYYMGEIERTGDGVPINPIYFFYDERGEPLFRVSSDGTRLVGWHPLVNILPGQTGYSPFWRVHRVTVKGTVDAAALDALAEIPPPAERCQMDALCGEGQRCIEERCAAPIKVGDHALDGIKLLDTLKKAELQIEPTDAVINCPVVDADAKLLKGISDPDRAFPKLPLWYRRLAAFCVLMEGSGELFGEGAPALQIPAGGEPPIADAYFIRQKLSFGTDAPTYVLPARNLVLTENLPGNAGYSALVREWTVEVDKEHTFKELRSLDEARDRKLPLYETERLHNLVVRGTIPACTTDEDCANTGGKVDRPLQCSAETGYCAPPFVRFGEECRRGVKECDPKGGPGGAPLVCVGLRVRDKYFCFNACDSAASDENPDPDIDSRCGSVPKALCYILRRSDPTLPNGVCIQRCNARAGDQQALLDECVSSTCGNGQLEYGETCDDGNRENGDGCNEFCSLSTFVRCENDSDCREPGQQCAEPVTGQGMTYCLPPLRRDAQGDVAADREKDERAEQDKYRTTCMEFEYCWPPDDRADWLGETEEGVQP